MRTACRCPATRDAPNALDSCVCGSPASAVRTPHSCTPALSVHRPGGKLPHEARRSPHDTATWQRSTAGRVNENAGMRECGNAECGTIASAGQHRDFRAAGAATPGCEVACRWQARRGSCEPPADARQREMLRTRSTRASAVLCFRSAHSAFLHSCTLGPSPWREAPTRSAQKPARYRNLAAVNGWAGERECGNAECGTIARCRPTPRLQGGRRSDPGL